MPKPTNQRELFAYLADHPHVVATAEDPRLGAATGRREFLRVEPGGAWFRSEDGEETFLPIGCRAHGDETGLAIDEHGFTVEKFGVRLRFDYAEASDAHG